MALAPLGFVDPNVNIHYITQDELVTFTIKV
jgi:hypothetical protein